MQAPRKPGETGTDIADDHARQRVVNEVVRIYERYAVEVVERFDLCPWAARSRRDGSAQPHVLLQDDPHLLDPSLAAVDHLAALKGLSVGLLIYPRFALSRLDFEHFLRRFRHADAERRGLSEVPFAMAAFHPDAAPDTSAADRLVPFIRRSPDPTIQLVRRDVLENVRGESTGTSFADVWMMSPGGLEHTEQPDVRERIAARNLECVERLGSAALEAVFADIARDRTATYARLGLLTT